MGPGSSFTTASFTRWLVSLSMNLHFSQQSALLSRHPTLALVLEIRKMTISFAANMVILDTN